jgi:hypothetical protein
LLLSAAVAGIAIAATNENTTSDRTLFMCTPKGCMQSLPWWCVDVETSLRQA